MRMEKRYVIIKKGMKKNICIWEMQIRRVRK